jgi:hypothetical protein
MPKYAEPRIDFAAIATRIRVMAGAVRPPAAASPGGGTSRYSDPRAHELRAEYLRAFGGDEIPVPVESIAEDLLGLRIELSDEIDCSGVLLPAERRILLNMAECVVGRDTLLLRRFRFTISHEIGHWVCHCLEGAAPATEPSYCRSVDLTAAADRKLEREANVFAAELLMAEFAVRGAWDELGDVAACAARFDVSLTAMQWRLYSFGLVSERPGGL